MAFEKGLAKWIGQGEENNAHGYAPILKTEFAVDGKCEKAEVCISGLGIFVAKINGKRLEDAFFAPGESDCGKRVYFVRYDITDKIREGKNEIEIILGNGQYTNFILDPVMEKDGKIIEPHRYQKNDGLVVKNGIYGKKKAICEIYADGELIKFSDDTWRIGKSAVTFQNWYGGEDYDARLEGVSEWRKASLMEAPEGVLTERFFPPVKVIERLRPVKILKNSVGYVLDFGKNGAGVVELCVDTDESMAGVKIKMRPGEEIDRENRVDQRSSTQSWSETKECVIEDSYIIKGSGKEVWRPEFCYHGFRYMEIEGFPGEPKEENFTYCRLMTDNKRIGSFETDSEILMRINEMTERSIESNMFSAFTDCPQIEKLGWLETSHLMFYSMAYTWDIKAWMEKIIRDIYDAGGSDKLEGEGYVPAIVPEFYRIVGLHRDPNWGGACIFTPWNHYSFYGDKEIFDGGIDVMEGYLKHLYSYSEGYLLKGYAQMGDWGQINENTPTILVENCAWYMLVVTFAKILKVMGEEGKSREYEELAEKIKKAFHENKECYNKETRIYGNGSQSSYACVIYSDIVKEENLPGAILRLEEKVLADGCRITSGEVGLRQVFKVLSENGRDDLIYKMVTGKTPPGYGYFVEKELTTLPEYWNYEELWWGMVRSRNHAMMGHVKQWLVERILGIGTEKGSSDMLLVHPFVAPDTTWAKGSVKIPTGEIELEWKKEENGVRATVTCIEDVNFTLRPPKGYCDGKTEIKRLTDEENRDIMIVKVFWPKEK